MEKAIQIAFDKLEERYSYVKKINMYLIENLKKFSLVQINTPNEENPYIINLGIKGIKAVDFKRKLEEYGVCISIKSACSTLIKIEEMDKFLEIFAKCYKELCN